VCKYLYIIINTNIYKMTKLLNIKIDNDLYDNYKKYCEENTYNLSERLRQFIVLDMKLDLNEKDIIKEIKKLL
jgi:hypothetical protein